MNHQLPPLPYDEGALEPHLSRETIQFHYGKHHQAYVNNLNKLIVGTEFENRPLESVIKTAAGTIFNNAAQIWNHDFFWKSLSPQGGGEPDGDLRKAILNQWSSVDAFKTEFTQAALSLFGSGWTWLIKTADGRLAIEQTANANTPLQQNQLALLTLDVWEHAYYIDYRNNRAAFVETFWKIVNWHFAEQNFQSPALA